MNAKKYKIMTNYKINIDLKIIDEAIKSGKSFVLVPYDQNEKEFESVLTEYLKKYTYSDDDYMYEIEPIISKFNNNIYKIEFKVNMY